MKKLILIVVLGLICSTGAFAQKVYKDGTKVILDLSVAAGMPAGAVDATPKAWSGTPSNSADPMDNNNEHGSINAKVYPKLEIAPHNMNSDGAIGTTGTLVMFWAAAFNACMNSISLNGGWRLPTQRELQYMWIFKSAFDDLLPTSFGSVSYWSATESNASTSWYVNFNNGFTGNFYKTTNFHVRCVREL